MSNKEKIEQFPDLISFCVLNYTFYEHLSQEEKWSQETFGPGTRLEGVFDHIQEELKEIAANPSDPEEWADLFMLVCDGALRNIKSPDVAKTFVKAIYRKFFINRFVRKWPDWRTQPKDKAIKHLEK